MGGWETGRVSERESGGGILLPSQSVSLSLDREVGRHVGRERDTETETGTERERERDRDRQTDRDRETETEERERERENSRSNSEALFYKHCCLGSLKT